MSLISHAYRFLPSFKGKKRIGSVLFKNAVYQKEDLVISCKRGLKFHVLNTHDSVGRDLFFDGVYEPETVRLIESLIRDDDVIVDAGANIGAVSLPIAKENNVKIYAFEPGKNIYRILEKNIAINDLKNITAIQKGLSDTGGITDFYESERVHGWSGMAKIDSFNHYKIQTTTLDNFAESEGISGIKVLKADVQGWEYHLFKGAERLILEGRIQHVVFEYEWWAEENAGLERGAAQKFLMEKGYSLYSLDGGTISEPITEGTTMIHAIRNGHSA